MGIAFPWEAVGELAGGEAFDDMDTTGAVALAAGCVAVASLAF